MEVGGGIIFVGGQVLVVVFVVLLLVLVVLGVVLVIIEIVAKPLLLLRLKNHPPGPPKPPGNLVRVENPTRAISGGGL